MNGRLSIACLPRQIEKSDGPRSLLSAETTPWSGSLRARVSARAFTLPDAVRLLCRPASVDQDVGAGDEAGCVRAQEYRQRSDFLWLTPTAEGDHGNELGVAGRILHQWGVHFRCERTRADPIYRDAVRGQFQRQGLSHPEQARLARAVRRAARN